MAIKLFFWAKLSILSEKSFILPHGSWEERWKVSVIPDGRLRWTVKTNTGTKDLDSSFPLALNQFYHFAVVYSGYSMELYVNGELDTFLSHSGLMSTTAKSITFGRKDEGVTSYYLRGTLDEVRIYDAALVPDEIITLKTIWNLVTGVENIEKSITIYPNPVQDYFCITGISNTIMMDLKLHDAKGSPVNFKVDQTVGGLQVTIENCSPGLLILEVSTTDGVFHKKIIYK